MFEPPAAVLEDLGAQDTLGFLADQRAAADAAEAGLLLGVAHWADLHPGVHPDDDPDHWCNDELYPLGGDREIPLAGDGAPPVAEFALADLATSLALTEGAARRLVGDTLELRHRLPLCWARIHAGTLQAWRGRRIAQHTTGLSREAAAWLDRQVAPIAHRVSLARLERLIQVALLRFDPTAADADRTAAAQTRRVLVTDPNPHGISGVWALLDAPDARRLDSTLNRAADALATLGDTSSRDVRRATALGLLADPQAALDLLTGPQPGPPGQEPAPTGKTGKTELVLYVHLDDAALHGDRGTARLDSQTGLAGLSGLALQTVRDWAGHATQITVKPVIDCRADLTSPGYRPTPAHREQVLLRDHACVFPWCDKPGRNHDLDHIDRYHDTGPPSQTRSSNLARLCRFHHRLKTHGSWRYQRTPDGSYLWTSPHDHRYLVDNTGTTPLT